MLYNSNKSGCPGTISQKTFCTLRERTAVTHCVDVNSVGHEEYQERNIQGLRTTNYHKNRGLLYKTTIDSSIHREPRVKAIQESYSRINQPL